MFGKKNNKKRRGASKKDSAVTILTSGCEFNGKLYCRGASRIGGKVEGQIISDGILVIEEEAIIKAKIKAEEVIIQGLVQGSLEANTKVELTRSSRFDGDIVTPTFVINEGAQFNGRSSMSESTEKSDTTAETLVKSMDILKNKKKPVVLKKEA